MMHGLNYKTTVLVLAALCLLSTANTHVTQSLYVDSEEVSSNSFVGWNATTVTAMDANETASTTTELTAATTVTRTTTTATTISPLTATASATNETTAADPTTTRKTTTENGG